MIEGMIAEVADATVPETATEMIRETVRGTVRTTAETATETTPEIGTEATLETATDATPENVTDATHGTAPETALGIVYQNSLTATVMTEAMAHDATTPETAQQTRSAKPGRQTTRRSTARNRFGRRKPGTRTGTQARKSTPIPPRCLPSTRTIPSRATQSVHRASGANRLDSVMLVTRPGTASEKGNAMISPMAL
jgi:hypothetical protein